MFSVLNISVSQVKQQSLQTADEANAALEKELSKNCMRNYSEDIAVKCSYSRFDYGED